MKPPRNWKKSHKKLDDFAYIVAHDLKAPVRGINAYAGFLLENYKDRLDEEGQNQIESIRNLARHMDELISDLLHYSIAGRKKAVLRDVDLDEVINDTLALMEFQLQQQHVSITVGDNLPHILCSKANIAEIFRNLIENGIKYNEKDEKKIEIGCMTNHPKHPGGYMFFVRDNGIGIPEKHQKAVFDMFKRLHGQEQYGGGTGSGLAIVKKLIGQHNGDIWVESKEGEGSTFYFYLDCA